MANIDRVNGLRPVGTMSGSPWSGYVRLFEADASSGAIFPGDLVIMEADGAVAPAAAGSVELVGVCVGVVKGKVDDFGVSGSHSNLDLTQKYKPASTAGQVLVAVGSDVLYEAQEDGDTSDLALNSVGANVDVIVASGSTTAGTSGMELDSSTVVATAAQLRIVAFVKRPDNELGDWARWLVRISESHYTKIAGI